MITRMHNQSYSNRRKMRPEWVKSVNERLKDFKELQSQGFIALGGQFYPAVHYPGITMYPPVGEETLFKGYSRPSDQLFSVYAHIPFCAKYCSFCHYPVKITNSSVEKDYYLDTLNKEMDIYIKRLGLKTIKASSILVGGGTPTYLTPTQLKRFLDFFTSRINFTNHSQFSYDVDPATLLGKEGRERLKLMKSYGVGRLTIGVQSLDDRVLKKMNRPHNAKEALCAIEEAKKAGFKLNIEFIYGFPGQTIESWIDTIKKAATLEADEIQLYRIKIIPYGDYKSTMTRLFSQKPRGFNSIEEIITMKQLAILILSKNGYHENLGRVFTKETEDFSRYADDQCCKLSDQIGFGLTAFSSLRDRFILNTQDFKLYYSLIKQGKLPINRGLVRSKDDQLRWALILPLKNREVYKPYYQKITGVSLNDVFRKKIKTLKSFNLLREDDKVLALTSLGRFFADEVCQQFYHPKYMPFPATAYARGKLHPYND
ncbi:MAG: coproporphyrinogen-III oxidase family protein [Candidatus Omnitrophota bacterium]|nr:coproporphyrinogen-III oxidase family protein [Candidatus Omnitrophota bacterium]